MNGKHGRQRTLALIGTLAVLMPGGTAWSQTAPPFAQLLRQARDTPRVTALDADRKSTRLNSSHIQKSRMPSSA